MAHIEEDNIDGLINELNSLEEIDLPENFHGELMERIRKSNVKTYNWRNLANIAASFLVVLVLFSSSVVGVDLLIDASKNSRGSANSTADDMPPADGLAGINSYSAAGSSIVMPETAGGIAEVTNQAPQGNYADTGRTAPPEAAASPAAFGAVPEMRGSIAQADVGYEEKNVITYNITIEVDDFESAVGFADTLGGYTLKSSVSSDGLGYAAITRSVPSEQFYGAVSALKTLGTVKNENQYQHSVLMDARDSFAHYLVKLEERNRLMELLSKTTDIESMLIVDRRLENVVNELQSYKNQIDHYNNQANSPTVNITLQEKPKPVIFTVKQPGFLEKVESAFIFSLNAVISVAQGMMLMLSFLFVPCLIFGVFSIAAFWVYKRTRR